MSMTPEENKTPETEPEESTIFGASPTKQMDKKPKSGSKMLRNILVLVVVLALLGASAFAIIKFIPEPEEDTTDTADETVKVISLEHEKVKSVKITRKDSASVYNTTLAETTDEESGEITTDVTWTIEGIDPSLTETSSISMVMDTLLALDANREIEKEDGADYGFAAPEYTIDITGYDAADSRTLTIGKQTPTASGYYATADGGESVVLLDSADVEDFSTPDTDMAIAQIVNAAAKTDENADYFEESALTKVDYITLSGKSYPKTLRFEMNSNSSMSAYMTYVMTQPSTRYADVEKVTELFNIASAGLSSASAYCFTPTAAELSSYRLSSPDIVLSIKYGSVTVKLKASLQEDGNYAVIADGADIVFKVSADSLTFASYTAEDYTSDTVFIEMITELKNLTLTTTDKSYSFGIENAVAESEDEEDVLTITYEGNPLTTENFQNYYQYLVGIELNEKTFERVSGTPVLTVAATRTDGSQTGLRFIKHSDRRYYVEAAGEPVGFISTTYMDKILNYLADVAADKTVPEPY